MLYFPQWHPQCLHSPPHCRDFPFFLSRTILRTTNATTITNTNPTITVPILQDTSLSMFPYLFFPSDGSLALHSDDFIWLLFLRSL